MNLSLRIFIVVGLFAASYQAEAQVGLEGFSSGRYEVRKSTKKRHPASESETTPVVTDADGVAVRTLKASELAAEEKAAKEKAAKENESRAKESAVVAKPSNTVKTVEPVSVAATETEVQEPGISEQAESLFANNPQKIYEFYRESVHPDDIRNNRVELEIAPVATYNESQSNYAYRDYNSYFTAMKIRSNVWLTPLIGVSGQIMFSLAGDMDSVAGPSRIPAKYEFLDLGLNFRKFFGVTKKSNSMEFSILLSDNKLNVPSDNTSRARLKSQGLGLGMKARLPTSANYAWTVGGSFFPRIQHTESETGVNFQSGSAEESTRIGLEVGGEFKFTRESQMVWSLGVSSERNLFDGAASLPDPSTGNTPSNVAVTNSLYTFSLGYRWGH